MIVSNRLSAEPEEAHKQVHLIKEGNSMIDTYLTHTDPVLVFATSQSFSNEDLHLS